MNSALAEISEKSFLHGLTLNEALFKCAAPELIQNYKTSGEYSTQNIKPANNANELIRGLTAALSNANQTFNSHKNAYQALQNDILGQIKRGDLIPYGYTSPRKLTDKPIKIPLDLFLNGEVNWDKSELKNKKLEFEGIRLLRDLSPIIDIKSENLENTANPHKSEKLKNNILPLNKSQKLEKPKKPDFNNPDLHINEKHAAEFLGISHRTLQGMRSKGGGPKFVKLKKAVRYKIADLNKWSEGNKKRNTSE